MLKRYFIPLVLLLSLLAAGVYLFTNGQRTTRDLRAAIPIETFTLGNGLKVVVVPNDRLPIVRMLMVVGAGAADDPQGKTGIAHYLEHLMFTGTHNFPEGAYEKAIARVGGDQNAYTTEDATVYHAVVPKKFLSTLMTMEADRFANLTMEPAIVTRELKVILEERTMRTDNRPDAQWMEQLDAMTFLNHPYHNPTIGWAEDMVGLTPTDARDFFARYYRASNMVLVLAGDVTPREARRLAQRYFGNLPGGAAPARHWPKEPPIRLTRRGEMRDPRVKEPMLLRQYVAPSVKEGEMSQVMPLEVFSRYLGGGDTSALYTALVREQKLATDISTSYDSMARGPGLFRIIAVPAEGVNLAQLETALDKEMARILAAPLDASAIARAKTKMKAHVIFAQDGIQQLAGVIANLYASGLSEDYFYQWAEMIDKVTPEEARAAAQNVLDAKRAVTGTLLPEVATAPAVTSAPTVTPAPAAPTEAPHAP